jgi:hypothetical protein
LSIDPKMLTAFLLKVRFGIDGCEACPSATSLAEVFAHLVG